MHRMHRRGRGDAAPGPSSPSLAHDGRCAPIRHVLDSVAWLLGQGRDVAGNLSCCADPRARRAAGASTRSAARVERVVRLDDGRHLCRATALDCPVTADGVCPLAPGVRARPLQAADRAERASEGDEGAAPRQETGELAKVGRILAITARVRTSLADGGHRPSFGVRGQGLALRAVCAARLRGAGTTCGYGRVGGAALRPAAAQRVAPGRSPLRRLDRPTAALSGPTR
mmetsp:Transcript_14340/g.46893  ORF Transcript_14340/g.46893 Transcript_14340/m.46893 type:complete len:228 (-) Transcript_14340:152-835(-)